MKDLFLKVQLVPKLFFLSILALSVNFVVPISIYGSELEIPWADPDIVNGVPFENIKKIAQFKAEILWGEVALGPVIPYSNLDGYVTAYLFNFYIGDEQFPCYQEICKELTRTVSGIIVQHGEEENWQQKFGYIVLSATYNQVPIIEYANHLPQYYLRGEQAKAIAILKTGNTDPKLVHIYYGGPLEQWFEFEGQGKTILINAFTLKPYARERLVKARSSNTNTNDVIKTRVKQGWKTLEKFEPSFGYCARDSNIVDSVPFYTWSYGCTPTASAMLIGYWDERSYGRLVDYFFDHPDVPTQQTIYNVPNVQKELAIAMGTDTTTGGTSGDAVPGGQMYVANNINGYSFNSVLTWGNEWNDWCWDLIKSETDAGRPFHWMVFDYLRIGPHHGEIDTMFPVNHSIAGIGYIDNGALENDFVIVHDTWNAYVTYWALYTVYLSYTSEDGVATLVPSGAEPDNVKITYPNGGQVLKSNTIYDITWTSTGTGIDHCALYYSSDNCENWETIDDNASNTGSYAWTTPSSDMENMRVKIDAYNSSRVLLADDASRDNFQVSTGNASGIDTIAYENYSPYYVDALPTVLNGYPLDYYNVRFTPVDDCSLLAAQFYFARKGGTGWTLRAYVWSDDTGYPDVIIDSVDVPEDSIHTRHDGTGWTRAYFADKNIKFLKFQDFHIGYSLIDAGSGDSLPIIADYGFTDRSGIYWNDNFITLHSLTEGGHNFFIDAIVSYDYEGCEEQDQPNLGTSGILSLNQNHPNPFNNITTIDYQIPHSTQTRLTIYDVVGRQVRKLLDETQEGGYYSVTWDGRDENENKLSNGIYFYTLEVNGERKTKKILLLR